MSSSLIEVVDDYFLAVSVSKKRVSLSNQQLVGSSWGLIFVSVFSLDIAVYVSKSRVRW